MLKTRYIWSSACMTFSAEENSQRKILQTWSSKNIFSFLQRKCLEFESEKWKIKALIQIEIRILVIYKVQRLKGECNHLLLIFCNFDFWYTVLDNFPSYSPPPLPLPCPTNNVEFFYLQLCDTVFCSLVLL